MRIFLFFVVVCLGVRGLAQDQRGGQVWRACREAVTSAGFSPLGIWREEVKVVSPRNLSWVDTHYVSLAQPLFLRDHQGTRSYRSGFDGHQPWETDAPVATTPEKAPLAGLVDSFKKGSPEEETRSWMTRLPVLWTLDLKAEWLAEETVDTLLCDKLRLFHPGDGSPLADVWVDRDAHLMRRLDIWGAPRADRAPRATSYLLKDYRPTDGLMLPYLIEGRFRRTIVRAGFHDADAATFFVKPADGVYLPLREEAAPTAPEP